MGFTKLIAGKYFFSRKSKNAINIITGISMGGVMVGTAALIIVLSVFNGFEDLVLRLFDAFDPDIKITASKGKTFSVEDIPENAFIQNENIAAFSFVLEENALIKYKEEQYIATLKGVDENYINVSGIDSMMLQGFFDPGNAQVPLAVVGNAIAYYMHININDYGTPLSAFVPRKTANMQSDPASAFNRLYFQPSGIFSIQQEFDEKFIFTHISFMEKLLESEGKATAVEISVRKGTDLRKLSEELRNILSEDFLVETRYDMHAYLHKIMNAEKWAVFLILLFIVIIATFNIIGTQSMMIIEKKRDIALFMSMGASYKQVRNVFLRLGIMVVGTGIALGMFIGWAVCYIQLSFDLVKIESGDTLLLDAYPVIMNLGDFIGVFLAVGAIGLITAWFPLRQIKDTIPEIERLKK